MNIERNISDEVSSITALIQTAEAEYTSGQVVKRSIPADYRVLFVLFRSVTVSGVTYTVDAGSTKEKIFYEAVTNFKHSVENFANGNVHIIPIIKEVTQNVVSSITTYLQHSDIASILLDLAPAGMYDAVITASGPNWGWVVEHLLECSIITIIVTTAFMVILVVLLIQPMIQMLLVRAMMLIIHIL
jgi:hypothetical protein